MMKSFAAMAVVCASLVSAQSQPAAQTKAAAPAKPAVVKPAVKPAGFDKAAFEAYARYLLLWGPQIKAEVKDPKPGPMPGYNEVIVTGSYNTISIDESFYVSADGAHILRGTVYDSKKSPFANELGQLKTDLQPSLGTPGAKVVLVLFSDFQCGYCKEYAKQLHENLLKTYPKDVRLYFKDFPLDQIHPWAHAAAIAGRCVFRQNPASFWEFHDWIFEKQGEINGDNLRTKVGEWAQGKTLDGLQLARCMDNKSTDGEVLKSLAEGRALKITSTPTMFINGRPMPGALQWGQLKAVIDFELEHAQKTGEGGEKCCELTLPIPGKQ